MDIHVRGMAMKHCRSDKLLRLDRRLQLACPGFREEAASQGDGDVVSCASFQRGMDERATSVQRGLRVTQHVSDLQTLRVLFF